MRKSLFSTLLAAATMASCQQSDLAVDQGGVSGDVATLSINTEAMSTTRSLADNNVSDPTNYYLEVWFEGKNYLNEQLHSTDGKFSLRLITGQDYTLVAWADYDTKGAEGYYDPTDLTSVRVNPDALDINTTSRDAFTGTMAVNLTESEAINMPISRPFARINVATLDYEAIPLEKCRPTQVQVKYENIYTEYNALSQTVNTEETAPFESFHTAFVDAAVDAKGSIQLSADYLFVPESSLVNFTGIYTIDGAEDESPVIYTFANIPVKTNYQTNISGNILTKSADITVDVNKDWDGSEDHEVQDVIADTLMKEDFTLCEINTAEGLKMFSEFVNNAEAEVYGSLTASNEVNGILTADINLNEICGSELGSWATIGTKDRPYQGVFNGNNKTVSNLYIDTDDSYQGLFGYCYCASIKNLTVSGMINSEGSHIGGIIGYIGGAGSETVTASDCLIENCNNYVALKNDETISNADRFGGIAGYAINGVEIRNCNNYGNILEESLEANTTKYIGGIVGSAFGLNTRIINCHNYSTCIAGYWNIGGIVGFLASGAILDNCSNSANIFSTPSSVTSQNSYDSFGGIAGSCSSAIIANSINTGNITATYAGYSAQNDEIGGIVGKGSQPMIINCANVGNLDAYNKVGGIMGALISGSGGIAFSSTYITNCYSSASVKNVRMYAGGVLGSQGVNPDSRHCYITNCYWDNSIEGHPTQDIEYQYSSWESAIIGECTAKANADILSPAFLSELNANADAYNANPIVDAGAPEGCVSQITANQWQIGFNGYPTPVK